MASRSKRLAKARKVRSQIGSLLAELEAGDLDLAAVIQNPPAALSRVRLWDLMRRAPHLGEKGVEKCLRQAQVWPTTRLGNLTEDERTRVVNHLPPRVRG